jgi:uncharacterized protein (TIGR04222 family)
MISNPFNWTAGPFLTLYLSFAVIVFVLSARLRSTIGPAALASHQLNVLELAYLSGGAGRIGDAALLSLTSANGADITPKGDIIKLTDQSPLTALAGQSTPLPFQPYMTRRQFQMAIKPIVERIEQRLQELGYSPTDDQMTFFRLNTVPFVLLLLAFGTIKAFVGAERHHPVGILIFLLFVTALTGIEMAGRPTRTRAGTSVLQAYQASHARASRAPLDHELLLAVALSGAVVLSGTAYAPIYAASKAMSSGGDGGGGCGGGGGGGGGGGCGGCS